MAAIPYASASSRPVPTINIPFRSIISSSSSSSTHQRTPSPAASPSTPPTSGSSNRASAFFTGQFTSSSSSSSPAPSPPAASSSNRNSLVFLQSQQPPQQQSQQELQPHPMLYSAGRRSRRAARGLEISSGGRRTGGRDIDDMTDDELRAHLHHRTRLHSDDDVLPSRQASPAPPPPPAATAASSANNRTLSPLSGNITPNIPVSNGRTSSSSDLPAYFVDPSLPQYEYRARPVWPVYSSDSAGIPSTSSFFFTGGVQITPPPPPPPMADEVTCALLTASPLTSSPVDERTGMGGASMVRPTPFPTSSSTPGLPSTPERRILGLPNRNSPPVPPRSLPNTSGLSVLRGSSLLHTNAAAAARSLGSSSLGMIGVPVGGRSSVVSETEGTVALPPPAYEEQDSARRGSAPCPLGEPRSAAMVGSTIAIQPSASIPAAGATATPVPMPMSTATPTGGSPLGSSPSLPSVIPVPPVPTRSVSLPGANASMASAAATATAIVRNRQLQQQGVVGPALSSSSIVTSMPLGAGLGEGEGEGEVMMEEVILTPCTTPTSSANPRTPASEMNRQTALPSPPPSATFSRPSPPTITNRRPISQVIVRQYATVGASPSQSSSGSGSTWGMCGAGLGAYSVDDSQTEFRFGVQHGRSADNNNNNGGGAVMVRPPIPSERRSSRAVGRHMRAATSVLPSVTNHGQGQGGRGVVASGGATATATVPARQQGVRNRPPLSMSIFDPSSAPAPAQTQTQTEVSSSPSPSPSPASASQAQAQAVAAAAMFGLTAREWSLRLAWLGEQEGDGVLSAGSGPGAAARRSASISAS
ncbi:hypothetical protein A4X09_0g5016 [Tilletia walkeri]|uniref:Uncharacterized protein n=1 Tax=Tilletia walkeri TaxID=117179 RepID=A0A8X7N882_9BASI|nr:hypothetical protein A4X09_0g5016 [Tilletia walkeri]